MLNQDFKEFIKSLNDNGVRYLVVESYAVALHGYPRYTKDLDVWVEMTVENASKVIKALDQFGFGPLDLRASDFIVPRSNHSTRLSSQANRYPDNPTGRGIL